MFKKFRIALALGGGGARGFAHIGVIRALTEAGIPIDLITGSGIGAVVGGMYAQCLDIEIVEQKIRKFFFSEDFKKTGLHLFRRDMHPENFFGQISRAVGNDLMIQLYGNRMSLMKENRIGVIMDELLGEGLVENTRIHFAPVATDLETGVPTIFRTGSLKEGVKASSSIPGFLPPLSYKNHVFIDGGVAAPVPVEAATELGATFVIAVAAGRTLANEPMPVNMMETVFRSHLVTVMKAESLICEKADFTVRPAVGHRHWAEFDQIDELIEAGSIAVKGCLEPMRKAIRKKGGKIKETEKVKASP